MIHNIGRFLVAQHTALAQQPALLSSSDGGVYLADGGVYNGKQLLSKATKPQFLSPCTICTTDLTSVH